MRNNYATISDVDRQRIIGASLSGQSASMIANVMGVKQRTVNSIINKFTKEGRVEAKQRGGVKAPGYGQCAVPQGGTSTRSHRRPRSYGHRVLYLPPYSPFLNPIENMFSKWKEYVRRERPGTSRIYWT